MIRVRAAHVYVVTRRYDHTYFNAAIRWSSRHVVLVRLDAGDGLSGWGECWCLDRSAEALVRYLGSEVLPALPGTAVSERRLWQERMWHSVNLGGRFGMLAAALSGVDIALWDLAAREAGVPVHRLLAAQPHPVPVYAAGGLYREGGGDDLETELAGYLRRGFGTVKMKLGAAPLRRDVERLKRARAAIGGDAGLIVDMSYSLDRESSRSWAPILSDAGVSAIQSPFPVWRWDLMKELAERKAGALMGLEAEPRHEVLGHLLRIGALDILQLSPTMAGGFSGALRLAELATRQNAPVSLQCSSSAIAYAACLHLAAALPERVRDVECNMVHDTFHDRLPAAALEPVDGCVQPPDGHGLGVEPGPELPAPCVSLPE